MKLTSLLLLLLLRIVASAQIPGIPEPGITMYGTITSSGGGPVSFTTMNWAINDGHGNLINLGANVQQVQINSVAYYILRIPFDTRSFTSSSGTTTLTAPTNSLVLSAVSPTYDRSGVTLDGLTPTFIDQSKKTFTFTAAERGRTEEVDLQLPSNASFIAWVHAHFAQADWSNQAKTGPNADPDGDGLTNAQEFAGGTDPNDPLSGLKIVSIQPNGNGGFTFSWKAIGGTAYAIEKSTDFVTWNQIGTVTATGTAGTATTANYTDAASGSVTSSHYRIRASH